VRRLSVIVLIAFAGLGLWRLCIRASASEWVALTSPDRRFRLVVYRIPMMFCMPGGSSDAPGYVRLFDNRTGRLLEQKEVEMVQMVGFTEVDWSSSQVHIKLLADWNLPK